MATKKKETKKNAAETPKKKSSGSKEKKSVQSKEQIPSTTADVPVDSSVCCEAFDDANMRLFEKVNAEFGDYLKEYKKPLYSSDIQIAWEDFTGMPKYTPWLAIEQLPEEFNCSVMERFIDIVHSRPDWKIAMYRTFDPDGEMDYHFNDIHNTGGYKVRDYFLDEVLKRNKTIPDVVLDKYADRLDWDFISMYQDLSEAQIQQYEDRVNWVLLSTYVLMSERFLSEHRDRIDWSAIPSTKTGQELSEKFIRDFSDRLNWINIGVYSQLSESFMDVFADHLNWKNISAYQKLSDAFIERHSSHVDWNLIFQYQKLSIDLLDKCISNPVIAIYSDALFKYQKYDDAFLMRHFDSFSWSQINPFCSMTLQKAQKMHWEIIIKSSKCAAGLNVLDLMTEEDVTDQQTIEYGVPLHFIERTNPDIIDWDVVSMYRLPADFIERHKIQLNPLLIRYNNDLDNLGKTRTEDESTCGQDSAISRIFRHITETIKSWFARN